MGRSQYVLRMPQEPTSSTISDRLKHDPGAIQRAVQARILQDEGWSLVPDARAEDRFAREFARLRRDKGLSQAAVADLARDYGIHLDPTAVTRIEGRNRGVSLGEAVVLASVVGGNLAEMTKTESPVEELQRLKVELINVKELQVTLAAQAKDLRLKIGKLTKVVSLARRDVEESSRPKNVTPLPKDHRPSRRPR